MLGIVLSGGQSSRMGHDKGLMPIGDTTWAGRAYELLSQAGLRTFVSVNASQQAEYEEIFARENLVVDDSGIGVKGPLLGLLSLHKIYPAENLLVLAADMIQMNIAIIRYLTAKSLDQYDAFVFRNDQHPEPLCALYAHAALAECLEQATTGTLSRYSMKALISGLHVKFEQLQENQLPYFRNINSPGDFED